MIPFYALLSALNKTGLHGIIRAREEDVKMVVYHGSNLIVEKPRLLQQNRTLDFGSGFYTTTNQRQAEEFAIKVFLRSKKGTGVVSSYDFDSESCFQNSSVLRFEQPDESWLDFVSSNRNGSYAGEQYDVIIGPVADDNVYATLALYMSEQLTKEETLARLKIKSLFNQVVFSTEKSLSYLNFIESYEVKHNE